MAPFFQRRHGVGKHRRQFRDFHRQITSHVDDLRILLDRHRTRIHARGAGRTLPERLGRQRRSRIDDGKRGIVVVIAFRRIREVSPTKLFLQVKNNVAR